MFTTIRAAGKMLSRNCLSEWLPTKRERKQTSLRISYDNLNNSFDSISWKWLLTAKKHKHKSSLSSFNLLLAVAIDLRRLRSFYQQSDGRVALITETFNSCLKITSEFSSIIPSFRLKRSSRCDYRFYNHGIKWRRRNWSDKITFRVFDAALRLSQFYL